MLGTLEKLQINKGEGFIQRGQIEEKDRQPAQANKEVSGLLGWLVRSQKPLDLPAAAYTLSAEKSVKGGSPCCETRSSRCVMLCCARLYQRRQMSLSEHGGQSE